MRGGWGKITASAAATDALLAALPAAPGEAVPLASLRQRMAGVRWAAKPGSRELSASGRLGKLSVSVTGSPAAKTLGVNRSEVGAEPPYDIVGAMRARGVTLTEIACEEFGSGEWQRVFAGSAPGRAPFRLELGQRTAPLCERHFLLRRDHRPVRSGARAVSAPSGVHATRATCL